MQERDAARVGLVEKPKPSDEQEHSVRMLAARLDMASRLRMQGDTLDASAELKGLRVESQISLYGPDSPGPMQQVPPARLILTVARDCIRVCQERKKLRPCICSLSVMQKRRLLPMEFPD